jgi:hypothetical protein
MAQHPRRRIALLAWCCAAVLVASCTGNDRSGQQAPAMSAASPAATATAATVDTADTSETAPAAVDTEAVPTTATDVVSSTTSPSTVRSTAEPAARLSARFPTVLNAVSVADIMTQSVRRATDGTVDQNERYQAGADLQLALRWLAERPTLDAEVTALIPEPERTPIMRIIAARQFAAAARAARTNPAPPADEVPAWTIVEPLPIERLSEMYRSAEAATGVPWYWLAAIHLQETRFGRIVGVSSAGAVGPMQFLPTTWSECCVGDPLLAPDAILGAATYLAQSGAPDDMTAAVYQYNPSDSYVAAVTATAHNLRDNADLLAAYYGFQVFYATSAGDVLLPVGFSADQPVPARDVVTASPDLLGD